MIFKRILGLCDHPGCFKKARHSIVLRGFCGNKFVHLCDEHCWGAKGKL